MKRILGRFEDIVSQNGCRSGIRRRRKSKKREPVRNITAGALPS